MHPPHAKAGAWKDLVPAIIIIPILQISEKISAVPYKLRIFKIPAAAVNAWYIQDEYDNHDSNQRTMSKIYLERFPQELSIVPAK
jgi:hypothetical protein